MPAALKFTNLTILHPHKPYHFLNNFSSSSDSASTAGSATILRLKYSAGWSGRTTPYAPATHRRITWQILGGRKSYHFSSESGNRREDCQFFCNSKTNIDIKMTATVNRKVENQYNVSPWQDYHEQSPVHPPKLLTLPTILTIGRVAAVPLLVGSMYLIFVPLDLLFIYGSVELFYMNMDKKAMVVQFNWELYHVQMIKHNVEIG